MTADDEPAATDLGGYRVGQIVSHQNHLDYVGSPCPIESEVCAAFIARYLIVPTTTQAFFALQSSVGETAALTGRLVSVSFGEHHGVLFVSSVSSTFRCIRCTEHVRLRGVPRAAPPGSEAGGRAYYRAPQWCRSRAASRQGIEFRLADPAELEGGRL